MLPEDPAEKEDEEYTVISKFPGYLYSAGAKDAGREEATQELSYRNPLPAKIPSLMPDREGMPPDVNPPLPEIRLDQEILLIGKMHSTADKLLPYAQISRIHARIVKKQESWYISDMNSRNGTKINDRLLGQGEEYCLLPEDRVSFADLPYIYRI